MAAQTFKISTREWDERSYIQGLNIHKPTGTTLVFEADPGAGGETFEVHARTAAGKYLGKARVGYGHGSSVGVESTSNGTCNIWFKDEKANATGFAAYRIGQTGKLQFVKVSALPMGDVAIDQVADLICIRTGNHYRGYRLSAAKVGKAEKQFDFTIPGWGNRFQGHLVYGGRLFVHRDIATKAASKAHVFDYKGKQLAVLDTTKMGDEAEGFTEKDGTVYAVKRTGGTGPSRVIVATPLDVKVDPPKPPPITPPKPPEPPKPPKPARLHGVDVASYQKGWTPATGDAFVFVKATEGTGYQNPQRSAQLDAARAKGLLTGHYHWLTPGKPLEQAAYFVQHADIQANEPLWCDWEKQGDGKLPPIQDAATFIAEVQRLVPTSKVGLYTYRDAWMTTSVKAGDGLWIAQYGVDKPDTATDWIFWQYSDKPIDQNVAKFTNEVDLLKWAKIDRKPPAAKPPISADGKPPTTPEPRPFPVVPEYDTAERIRFRGGLVCRCLAVSLPWIEYAMLEAGVIKYNLDFYQFGYRSDVKASARTHAAGQMIDVGQYSDPALKMWREFGYMMQHRTPAQGFTHHGHGGPKGCPHGSTGTGSAQNQERAWNRGRDGLLQNRTIEGPEPRGSATPRWDNALAAYLKRIGAPPTQTT